MMVELIGGPADGKVIDLQYPSPEIEVLSFVGGDWRPSSYRIEGQRGLYEPPKTEGINDRP